MRVLEVIDVLDEYKESQSIFYNYIVNSVNNDCISHAYLIETNGVSYGLNLAVSLAKFFLCKNNEEKKDRIIYEVDRGIYPDFYLIDNDSSDIKKDDILDLKKNFSLKSQNDNYRIYIINNANLLNSVSSNSLLKFLEEPENDIIAILLVDSRFDLMDTIVSRCQVLSLINNGSSLSKLNWNNNGSSLNYEDFVNEEIIFFVDFCVKMDLKNEFLLMNDSIKKIKDNLYNFFVVSLYFYYDIFNMYYQKNLVFLNDFVNEKQKVMKNNSINVIINKINLINLFINKCNTNVNKDLLIDDFIFKMTGDDFDD